MTFAAGGLTVDTNGKNATLTETVNATFASDGTALVKTGDGTLTIDAAPSSGSVSVTGGTLAIATDGTREPRVLLSEAQNL